jgi:ribonuclease Z
MSMLVPTSTVSLGTQLTLVGRSRAGDGTSFVVPELHWMFDCGAPVSANKPVTHIFVTHTHGDHVAWLPRVLQQQHQNEKKSAPPVQIYLPEIAVPLMETYLNAWGQLTECDDASLAADKSDSASASALPYRLIGVKPSTELEVHAKGSEFVVRVVECDHRVTCCGYSVYQRRRKLKVEYAKDPSNIRTLIEQGIDPFHKVLVPLFTFLGDTTHIVFAKNPWILETKIVVVECSFLLDRDDERAAETKHMLWRHLEPHVRSNPETRFVLIHVSLKHSAAFVRTFFEEYRNVHPMLADNESAGNS